MFKEEWGVKCLCLIIGKCFYDLNKDLIVSLYIGEVVELDMGKSCMIVVDSEDVVIFKVKVNDGDDVDVLDDDDVVDLELDDDVLDEDEDDNVLLEEIVDMLFEDDDF